MEAPNKLVYIFCSQSLVAFIAASSHEYAASIEPCINIRSGLSIDFPALSASNQLNLVCNSVTFHIKTFLATSVACKLDSVINKSSYRSCRIAFSSGVSSRACNSSTASLALSTWVAALASASLDTIASSFIEFSISSKSAEPSSVPSSKISGSPAS